MVLLLVGLVCRCCALPQPAGLLLLLLQKRAHWPLSAPQL
jgi:hypothetical protein